MFCPNCGKQNDQEAMFCSKCGNQLPVTASVACPPAHAFVQTAGPVVLYAGFWKRFAAIILDFLVLLIPWFLIQVAIVVGLMSQFFATLVGVFLSWLYFAAMESSSKQATLGKMALGIKVVDLQGNRISFERASGRWFGRSVSAVTLLIGYFMAGFTKRKQALHDMMASCLVVNKDVNPEELQQKGPITGMSTGAIVALFFVASFFWISLIAVNYASIARVENIGDQATKAVEDSANKYNSQPYAAMPQEASTVPELKARAERAPAAAELYISNDKVYRAKLLKDEVCQGTDLQCLAAQRMFTEVICRETPERCAGARVALEKEEEQWQHIGLTMRDAQGQAALDLQALAVLVRAEQALKLEKHRYSEPKQPCVFKPAMTDEEIRRCKEN